MRDSQSSAPLVATAAAVLFLAGACGAGPFAAAPAPSGDLALKDEASASIERRRADLIAASDRIWALAETALRETRSSEALAEIAAREGFRIERGVAGMPTAFVATFGEGRPILGVLGEFDALPGLSQKAGPVKEPLAAGAPGHGCGHNLFGVASLGAALAIKDLIAGGRLKGTIRFYATPAEEAVGGKIYMARDGLFRDLDAAVAWHPSDETEAGLGAGQALLDISIEFRGRASHAAFDPWNGRSAVDALELFTHGVNLMREHVRPTVRMHYVIREGGQVPNVVPERASLWMWIRDFRREIVQEVFERVRKIAEGAAIAAGVETKISINGGDWEMLVLESGQRLVDANLQRLGPIVYTGEEQALARAIQKAAGVEEKGMDGAPKPLLRKEPEGGSTDVGDVSWNVPTLHMGVTTAPSGIPWHSWAVVAAGGTSLGHKGMMHAARAMSGILVDLYADPAALAAIRSEFAAATAGVTYEAWIPEGPPKVPAAPAP